MKIGLFFGSFNPFHLGHKIIASYISECTDIKQIWFVISPQNPFKEQKELLDKHDRLRIIRIAVENNPVLFACDIEFNLSPPNYTIDTLVHLTKKYPQNEFILIMGADNLQNFNKWKNYKQILENYSIYVCPRPGIEINHLYDTIHILENVPKTPISSSFIRNAINEGEDVSCMIPEEVWKYMDQMNFYR